MAIAYCKAWNVSTGKREVTRPHIFPAKTYLIQNFRLGLSWNGVFYVIPILRVLCVREDVLLFSWNLPCHTVVYSNKTPAMADWLTLQVKKMIKSLWTLTLPHSEHLLSSGKPRILQLPFAARTKETASDHKKKIISPSVCRLVIWSKARSRAMAFPICQCCQPVPLFSPRARGSWAHSSWLTTAVSYLLFSLPWVDVGQWQVSPRRECRDAGFQLLA